MLAMFYHINIPRMIIWSGCSDFVWISFFKVKIKPPFYKKQVINKSANVIFGLIRLIILNYNT